MFLRENTEQGSSKKGTLQVAMVLRGGVAINSFTLFFVAFYVLYYSTTNMSYVYAQMKLLFRLQTLKSVVVSTLPCQVHQDIAPVVCGGKKAMEDRVLFFQGSENGSRMQQGCSERDGEVLQCGCNSHCIFTPRTAFQSSYFPESEAKSDR